MGCTQPKTRKENPALESKLKQLPPQPVPQQVQ